MSEEKRRYTRQEQAQMLVEARRLGQKLLEKLDLLAELEERDGVAQAGKAQKDAPRTSEDG